MKVSKAPIKCGGINEAEALVQVWLFPGRSSGHLCTKTVLRTVDRLAEEAGIQEVSPRQKLSRRKVTPHILRRSHVVNALMAGVPVPMIQKPGGAQRGFQRRRSTPRWRWPLVKEAYDLHGFGPVSAWI
jgi:integrase